MGEEALDASDETALAIKGYRDAMTYVLQLAEEPRFRFEEQLIKSLHFMMTSYDLKSHPGRWRLGIRPGMNGQVITRPVLAAR